MKSRIRLRVNYISQYSWWQLLRSKYSKDEEEYFLKILRHIMRKMYMSIDSNDDKKDAAMCRALAGYQKSIVEKGYDCTTAAYDEYSKLVRLYSVAGELRQYNEKIVELITSIFRCWNDKSAKVNKKAERDFEDALFFFIFECYNPRSNQKDIPLEWLKEAASRAIQTIDCYYLDNRHGDAIVAIVAALSKALDCINRMSGTNEINVHNEVAKYDAISIASK